MKKFKLVVLTIMSFAILCTSVLAASGYSWYFKPSKNGAQPEIIPEASEYIDDYKTIYMGDDSSRRIYLTFDAGYENGNVEKILDILSKKDVKGAFFVLPQLSKNNVDLLKRMKEEGHLVCNHTNTHKDMSKADYDTFKRELTDAEKVYKESTGFDMDKFYRPPEGRFNEQNLKWAQELGYTTVFWSLAYADWNNEKQMNPEDALDLIVSRTHNGCVVLLHPTSQTNVEILGDYIDIMKSQGFRFCSLYEFDKAE